MNENGYVTNTSQARGQKSAIKSMLLVLNSYIISPWIEVSLSEGDTWRRTFDSWG